MSKAGLAKRLVIAFDPDSAGAGGLKKWKAHYHEAKAVTPVRGDWNDFLRNHAPESATKALEGSLPEFEVRARLLLAESAHDYATVYRDHYERSPGLFAFNGRYWFSSEKAAKNGEGELLTYPVSNFTLEVDHYELDRSTRQKPCFHYHLKVKPQKGTSISCSVSGTELATPGGIRAALLDRACVAWDGEAKPSTALVSMIVNAGAPTVRQVFILGHDQDSGCLVFRDFLVDPSGIIVLPDGRGFFRVSRKEFLMPPDMPTIRPRHGTDPREIYNLIASAWPGNGPLVFAFVVASWFVNVVKPELGFFPFCSLFGDTQTGKSRLVKVMNSLQCLDEEGLPMTKLNTGKGEIRKLAQRSALFKALLEGNQAEKTRFDFELLLPLYNAGNHLQVSAVKSNDLRTRDTQFPSTLIFVQNREPFKGKAQMERVVSSKPFLQGDITRETTEAFNELIRIPIQEMAYTYLEIMRHRKSIETEWPALYTAARKEMFSAISDNRIAENHGLILAFHRVVTKTLGVSYDLTPLILDLSKKKHEQCSHRQATLADSFFEALNELSDEVACKFTEMKDGRLLVKLPLALKTLDGHGYRFIQAQVMNELREHPAFLGSRISYRGHFGSQVSESVKVWAFDPSKIV